MAKISLNPNEVKMNYSSGLRFGNGFGLTPFEQSPGYQAALERTSGSGSNINGGVGGNAAGLPGIESLTSMVNEINQRAQQAANAGRIPGGAGLEQQSSTNIGAALRGEVPWDVIRLLGQQAAERGVSTGSPMGPASNADYLRALGLTSQQQMNTGQNWLSQATARNPAAPIYDAGNQVLTAAQVQQAILERERMANALRIAQMNAVRGRGGVGGGAQAQTPSIARSAANWQNIIKPTTAPGWNFPPGYENIPIGGNTPGAEVTDQQFVDYWFPENVDYGYTPTPTAPYMDPNYAGDYSDYFDVDYGD